jgi:hypothetical protein
MCNQTDCPADQNELGMPGAFGEADRDALALFLRAVPYPPARLRRLDDQFSPLAAEGFRNLLIGIDDAHPGCSRARACHALPFWAGTNTSDTGFDAPTFRGIPDRTLLLPNGRAGMWQLLSLSALNPVDWDPLDGPDELYSWAMTFGTEALPLVNRVSSGTGPFSFFQLFEEGSTGFSAAFARQVTLDRQSTRGDAAADTRAVLKRLERADANGVVELRAIGRNLRDGSAIELAYDGPYQRFARRRRPPGHAGRYRHGPPRGTRGRRAPAAHAVALPAQPEQPCGPRPHPRADHRADAQALRPAHRREPDRPGRRTGRPGSGDLRAGRRATRLRR